MRPVSRSAANERSNAIRLMLAISSQHAAVVLPVFICGIFLSVSQEISPNGNRRPRNDRVIFPSLFRGRKVPPPRLSHSGNKQSGPGTGEAFLLHNFLRTEPLLTNEYFSPSLCSWASLCLLSTLPLAAI